MKRNGTRRLYAALLALIMVLVLLPVGAAKAADEGYLTVGGTAIDLSENGSYFDGKVVFEIIDGKNVLTLNGYKLENYNGDGIYANRIDLTIVGSTGIGVTGATASAIFVNKGNLTLNGDFTLRAQCVTGPALSVDGNLTVEDGALDVENSYEGCEAIFVNECMTVNGGTIHAKANGAKAIDAIYGIILNNDEAYLLGDANAYEVKIGVGYTITFVNEDGTELQSGAVAVGETPAYTGEEPKKPATVTQSYAFAGWKDENGIEYGLTDDLPAVNGEMTYTAIYTQREIVYGEPEWTWTGYESAEATFTGTDGETLYTQLLPADEIFHMTTVEPDCENPGIVTYTASVIFLGKTYYNNKNKEIAPRGHEWVFDAFVWQKNAQGVYYALAQFHCARVESHTLSVNPVGGMATDPATCTEDGCEHYVAFLNEFESPDGQYHEDKLEVVIPAHGHWWSEPDLERTKTETGYQVTATVRCLYDYSHQISETVDAVYEVVIPPTLHEEGLCKYTATFTDPHLHSIWWTEPIPKLVTTFYGTDTVGLDMCTAKNGAYLYRYDIRVKNLENGALAVNSMQIFVTFDHAVLELALCEGPVEWVVNDGKDLLSAAWASETATTIADDEIVLTLWFKKIGDAPDTALPIAFTKNELGSGSALSYVEDGTVREIEVGTENGSLLLETPVIGDANCDGVVTAADAALTLRAIVGLSELTPRGAMQADANGDLEITAEDAALILRLVVGLIDEFSASV